MAAHIEGPLYYERMGRTGPVMALVHPNPMDQSCWIFQMAHMSTWYRMHCHRYSRLRPIAESKARLDHERHGAGVFGKPSTTLHRASALSWWGARSALQSCPTCITEGRSRLGPWCCPGPATIPARNSRRGASLPTPNKVSTTAGATHSRISIPAFRATPLAQFFADLFSSAIGTLTCSRSSTSSRRWRSRTPTITMRVSLAPPLMLTGSEDGSHPRAAALKARIPNCRDESSLRRRPRLPDRATVAFQSLHDRVSQTTQPVPLGGA